MTEERLEKIRKLREMKKFGKKVQIEVQQKREKEKKEMLDQVGCWKSHSKTRRSFQTERCYCILPSILLNPMCL